MQIHTLVQDATRQLAEAGVEEAALDARLLLEFVTSYSRSDLILRAQEELAPEMVDQYRKLIGQRQQHIPLQYLTGEQEFWSLSLRVTPAVLIPRPETEFVLEQALAVLPRTREQLLLDMCTGSGAIALVLARELGCRVVGADLSEAALAVACHNCSRHQGDGRVDLVCSDLFTGLHAAGQFDAIISNPPYIADAELAGLEPEVARYEPMMALSGGASGLDCIRRIIARAPAFLRPGGWLVLEIGADQQSSVQTLFQKSGCFEQIVVLCDYAGLPRVARGCFCHADC